MTPILHIEHPEDSVLTGDLSFLDAIRNRGVLSVKMDGAPAIVWGRNPASGKFFVGTKSVFNKVKIKINESHADIDANHSGGVANILHLCLDYLPRTEFIYQGDFIGFGGKCEYTPNTVTYKFPEIVEEILIVAPHTVYNTETTLREAVAEPLRAPLSNTQCCRFVTPRAYVWSGSYCSLDEQFELPPAVDMLMSLLPTVEFVSDKDAAQIRINVNRTVREGKQYTVKDFMGNANLMAVYSCVQYIKEECLAQCRVLDGPEAYIDGERISAEGYVYSYAGKVYKLVNRKVFSVANFNNSKYERTVAI